MSARSRAIAGVCIMGALLVLYFVFAGVRAVALLSSGTPLAITIGVALLVLPLIGAWALIREIVFGANSTKLVDALDAADQLPDDLGEATARGKADRSSANEAFARYRAEAEADPERWQSWARLGIVYDACGDRKRARQAMREAIARHRAAGRAAGATR